VKPLLEKKRMLKFIGFFFLYLVFTTQLHYAPISNPTISHIRHLIKGLLDMLPLIFWFWFIKTRVIQPLVRGFLVFGSIAMEFSMFVIYLQTIVVTDDINLMAASVVGISTPYIIFPTFSLMATLCLGTPEQYVLPKKFWIIPVIASIFTFIAFTNRFHRWYFKFAISPDNVNRTGVELGWACYLSIVFSLIVCICRLIGLKRFSHKNGRRSTFVLVLLLFISIIVYHIPYIMNGFLMKWEFIGSTQYTVFIEAVTWLVCMSNGIVPVNTGYDRVYEYSSLNFEIYDKNGNIFFPTPRNGLSPDIFERLVSTGRLESGQNTVLHISPLKKKGYVVWKQDISFINQLTAEQDELKKQLEEQEIELQNELTLANEREKIRQKQAIYEKIDELLKTDVGFLDSMLKKLSEKETFDPEIYKAMIQRGIFVKRKGNLLILDANNPYVPLSELKLTMDEMMTGLYGIKGDSVYLISLETKVRTKDVISCLELFFNTLTQDNPESLHLRLFKEEEESKFGLYCQTESGEKFSRVLSLDTKGGV